MAFGAEGARPGALAAKAETAGERVEGAQREAIAEVTRLGNAFGRTGRRATTMGAKAVAARRKFTGAVGGVGAAFGLAGGAFGGASVAKRVAEVEYRMERLGTVSQRSTGEMAAFRDELYAVSNMPDIRVDPSQMLAAVESVVEKTGDLDYARGKSAAHRGSNPRFRRHRQ